MCRVSNITFQYYESYKSLRLCNEWTKENLREIIELRAYQPRNVAFSLVSFHCCCSYMCTRHQCGSVRVSRTQAATHLCSLHRCTSPYWHGCEDCSLHLTSLFVETSVKARIFLIWSVRVIWKICKLPFLVLSVCGLEIFSLKCLNSNILDFIKENFNHPSFQSSLNSLE